MGKRAIAEEQISEWKDQQEDIKRYKIFYKRVKKWKIKLEVATL